MRFQGFPASRRIRRRRDFSHIYASGQKQHSAHFILFALFQQGQAQRVGIAASKKVGNAVARNRVKRLLREYFRTLAFSLPGCQFVAVAKPGSSSLCLCDVARELGPLLARLAGARSARNNL